MTSQQRAAVLGSPIQHSKSPALHSAAYRLLGVEIDYTRREVSEQTLPRFLSGEGAEPGWVGWSVTMPLKAAMVEHMTTYSPRVKTLGVLNTVVIDHDADSRRLHGENTDVDGILRALTEAELTAPGPTAAAARQSQRPFAVLGAGGTAAAALGAAAERGHREVVVYARSLQRAASAVPLAQRLGLECTLRELEAFPHDVAATSPAAVVSTLPPRAADPLAAALGTVTPGVPLLDAAYDPWPSQLAIAWENAGGQVASGLSMLLHQAVKQVELFTASTGHPAGELAATAHRQLVETMRTAIGLQPPGNRTTD
ncbi:shikimate dehydrogenase [Nesterenkonia alba]|uniref:shikimate dehydrogenase n=1 Tax=Nesterenkonia alba TaxID=515814 RepID=UPI0003B44F32|nr:shikimate dehydrogenase [Nesterenkonia alba]